MNQTLFNVHSVAGVRNSVKITLCLNNETIYFISNEKLLHGFFNINAAFGTFSVGKKLQPYIHGNIETPSLELIAGAIKHNRKLIVKSIHQVD